MNVVRPDLPDLQQTMARAFTDLGDDRWAELAAEIVPGGILDVAGAVEVHRRGYVATLTEQLGETYEGVWWVLGDDAFFAVCRDYISGHLSESYDLSDYGADFADFLAGGEYAAEFPFLTELARFELDFQRLFHTGEHEHVGAERLAGVADIESAVFEIGSAVSLFTSPYAVHSVWRSRKGAQPETAPDWSYAERLLSYKLGGEIYVCAVSEAAYAVIASLAQGVAVGPALADAAGRHTEFDEHEVAELFRLIATTGIVTAVHESG